jgi:hypothetical protein
MGIEPISEIEKHQVLSKPMIRSSQLILDSSPPVGRDHHVQTSSHTIFP